jgi:putative transposase
LRLTRCVPIKSHSDLVDGWGVPGYPTDLNDAQWALLAPLVQVPGKRGRKFSGDVRRVIDGVLYITHTGCQWRCLPHEFGPWTRVWSQFRRWSRNGTWARLLAALHRAVRTRLGRAAPLPSMVVMDTHLGRGASNGGKTFHDRGGPYGATNGAKRAIAVDVTGLPLAARVLPASTHENAATSSLLEDMAGNKQNVRLRLVLVDRGVSEKAATSLTAATGIEVRRVFHDGPKGSFVPLPYAWRVEVAHSQLLRSRRLARSFENSLESATGWLQISCLVAVLDALVAPPRAAGKRRRSAALAGRRFAAGPPADPASAAAPPAR